MNESDLDKFLVEADREEANRRIFLNNIAVLNERLRNSGVPHLYDEDRDARQQLMKDYAGDDEAYHNRLEVERIIVGLAAMLMSAEKAGTDAENLTGAKKSFVASQLIHGMDRNDPLLRFFEENAPGESLDMENESDAQYVVDAMTKINENEASTKQFEMVVYEVWELLRQRTMNDPDELLRAAGDMAMGSLFNAPIFEGRAESSRENHVVEVCRKYNLNLLTSDAGEQPLIPSIVDILEAHFPLK